MFSQMLRIAQIPCLVGLLCFCVYMIKDQIGGFVLAAATKEGQRFGRKQAAVIFYHGDFRLCFLDLIAGCCNLRYTEANTAKRRMVPRCCITNVRN